MVDALGNPTTVGAFTVNSATLSEVYSAQGWTIGRYSGGTITVGGKPYTLGTNEGINFAVVLPPSGALPNSGIASYKLLSATAPTFLDGSVAPGGSFAANVGIKFGSAPLLGYDGVLTMNEAGKPVGYVFTTEGGSKAPSLSQVYRIGGSLYIEGRAQVSTAGNLCAVNGCLLYLRGSTGGEAGKFLGTVYELRDVAGGRGYIVSGAAMFGQDGVTAPPNTVIPTTPIGPGAGPLAGAANLTGVLSTAHNSSGSGQTGLNRVAPTVDSAGRLIRADASLYAGGSVAPGSTVTTDVYSDGVVAIGRWTDGTTTSGVVGTSAFSPGPKEAMHYAAALPVALMPTGGTASYALAAATQPTYFDGSTAPGTVDSASFNLFFGSKPNFELIARIVMPEASGNKIYDLTTATGTYGVNTGQVSATGALSGTGQVKTTSGALGCNGGTSCPANILGQLGADYKGAALIYQFGGNNTITGSLAFKLAGQFEVTTGVASTTPSGSSANSGLIPGQATMVATGRYASNAIGLVPNAETGAATYDATGGLATFNSGFFGTIRNVNAVIRDASSGQFGGSGWEIGRFTGGQVDIGSLGSLLYGPNYGLHYVVMAPPTGVVPTGGSAQYTMTAATMPSFSDGRSVSAAAFNAKLGVAFGSEIKVGIEGSLSLTDILGARSYSFTTPGGAASPSASAYSDGLSFETNGFANAFVYRLKSSGKDAGLVGLSYELNGISSQNGINAYATGAALFSQSSFTPGGTTFVPARADSRQLVYSGSGVGTDFRSDYLVTADAATGAITRFANRDATREAVGSGSNVVQSGSATSATDMISWSRWSAGTADGVFLGPQKMFDPRNANQGFHIVSGAPARNVPTSGTAQYAMVSASTPTIADGSVAPGNFTGSLGVDFATRKVGLTSTVTIGGGSYAMNTSGGSANPGSSGLSLIVDATDGARGATFSGGIAMTGGGVACTTGSCTGYINGFLSGEAGKLAGLGYLIQGADPTKAVSGVAIFKQP